MVMRESQTSGESPERLGRYEILGEIASGGMATVFLGRVTGAKGFSRLVAIKRLHPHLESEEDFVSMFLDEARLAARIRHPNVVATLDVEDQAGLYIVMEYIEGDRLLGLLRHAAKNGERIPPPIALRIALDTLAGLHAAHELREDDGELIGLVHRDVSPQNVLIGIDGVARLTDFGIAKAASRLTVTRDGQLKGKIAYMAPEQTKRVEIDRRVDIFAMGIITWEMLTGIKLFTGESDVEVLNQLLFEPIPRLKDNAPGLPAALDVAVMRALERDPQKRFASAAEFGEALERAAKIIGGPANPRTVAAHVQKVAGEKLARDRARIAAGATLAQPASDTPGVPTNSRVQRKPGAADEVIIASNNPPPRAAAQPPPAAPPAAPAARRSTMMGLGTASVVDGKVVVAPAPPPRAAPQPPPAAPPPAEMADTSLIDDDEDIPTQAHSRANLLEAMQQASARQAAAAPPPPRTSAPNPDFAKTTAMVQSPLVAVDPAKTTLRGAGSPPAPPTPRAPKSTLMGVGTATNPDFAKTTLSPPRTTGSMPVADFAKTTAMQQSPLTGREDFAKTTLRGPGNAPPPAPASNPAPAARAAPPPSNAATLIAQPGSMPMIAPPPAAPPPAAPAPAPSAGNMATVIGGPSPLLASPPSPAPAPAAGPMASPLDPFAGTSNVMPAVLPAPGAVIEPPLAPTEKRSKTGLWIGLGAVIVLGGAAVGAWQFLGHRNAGNPPAVAPSTAPAPTPMQGAAAPATNGAEPAGVAPPSMPSTVVPSPPGVPTGPAAPGSETAAGATVAPTTSAPAGTTVAEPPVAPTPASATAPATAPSPAGGSVEAPTTPSAPVAVAPSPSPQTETQPAAPQAAPQAPTANTANTVPVPPAPHAASQPAVHHAQPAATTHPAAQPATPPARPVAHPATGHGRPAGRPHGGDPGLPDDFNSNPYQR